MQAKLVGLDYDSNVINSGRIPYMYDIFLSYSTKDRERLIPLVEALESCGWSVFWDHRSVPIGKDWHDVIGDAIRECRSVIVAWSQHSIDSKWVREEALEGRDREALFPILLDGTPQPFGFKIIQSADFTNWDGQTSHPEFLKLEAQIRQILGKPVTSKINTLQPATSEVTKAAVSSDSVEKRSRYYLIGAWLTGIGAASTVGAGLMYFFMKDAVSPTQLLPSSVTANNNAVSSVQHETAAGSAFEPVMVEIPSGAFIMGCQAGRDDVEKGCFADEKPAYEAKVDAFKLGKYEVTTKQYLACVNAGECPKPRWQEKTAIPFYKKMGESITGDNYPIVGVSWNSAQSFVKWLNKQTGKHYRLPSETEWEYAARAGTNTAFPFGQKIGVGKANCLRDNCGDDFLYAAPVGSFTANPFGLYDMQGNVWEWVQDLEGDYPSKRASLAEEGDGKRIVRGGSWANYPEALRSAYRHKHTPTHQHYLVGFRVAMD